MIRLFSLASPVGSLALVWSASAFGAASVIEPAHAGSFSCVCAHEGCGSSAGKRVSIVLDQAAGILSIDYGADAHSGAPDRVVDKASGATTYHLSTQAKVGFKATGEMAFGWGRLWTCARE